MAGIKSSGWEVEQMIREGNTLMEIEVLTNWPADGIKALAVEVGFAMNAASTRFQKVAKAKPTPMGIVRSVPQTDTGAGVQASTGVAPAETVVAAPVSSPRAPRPCGGMDTVTGRVCAKVHDHDGNHQDSTGNRAWPQTGTGTGGDPNPVSVTPLAPAPVPTLVIDDGADQELTPPAPAPIPSPVTPTVVEVEAPTSSPPTSTTVTDPSALITAGLAHVDDSIGDLALQAKVAIDRLAAAIVTFEQRADALAEVHRLEAARVELDDALVAARRAAGLDVAPVEPGPVMIPAPTKRKPVGVSFTEMREWAQSVGRDWGRGRPTNALIAEYQAATEGISA